jgi:WD40 repeat protein
MSLFRRKTQREPEAPKHTHDESDFHSISTIAMHAGFSRNSTWLDYHVLEGLLLTGDAAGGWKVLGKHGFQLSGWVGANSRLTHVLWLYATNQHKASAGALFVCAFGKSVQLWDLAAQKSLYTVHFESLVTSVAYSVAFGYLFVGQLSGDLGIVNLDSGCLSEYSVDVNQLATAMQRSEWGWLSAIASNDDDATLLLAYSKGGIVHFDLTHRKPTACYIADGLSSVSSLVFHYDDAKRFYAGYDSGCVACWRVGSNKKPESLCYLADAPRHAVSALLCTKLFGETALFVFGGTQASTAQSEQSAQNETPPGLSLIQGERMGKTAPMLLCSANEGASIGCLCFASPWFKQRIDPSALIYFTASGTLRVLRAAGKALEPVSLPWNGAVALHDAQVAITALACTHADQYLLSDLAQLTVIDESGWPLTGGAFGGEGGVQPDALLISGHADGRISLWDLGYSNLPILAQLNINEHVRGLTLCADSRVLVAWSERRVFVFVFSNKPLPRHSLQPSGLKSEEAQGEFTRGFQLIFTLEKEQQVRAVDWESSHLAVLDSASRLDVISVPSNGAPNLEFSETLEQCFARCRASEKKVKKEKNEKKEKDKSSAKRASHWRPGALRFYDGGLIVSSENGTLYGWCEGGLALLNKGNLQHAKQLFVVDDSGAEVRKQADYWELSNDAGRLLVRPIRSASSSARFVITVGESELSVSRLRYATVEDDLKPRHEAALQRAHRALRRAVGTAFLLESEKRSIAFHSPSDACVFALDPIELEPIGSGAVANVSHNRSEAEMCAVLQDGRCVCSGNGAVWQVPLLKITPTFSDAHRPKLHSGKAIPAQPKSIIGALFGPKVDLQALCKCCFCFCFCFFFFILIEFQLAAFLHSPVMCLKQNRAHSRAHNQVLQNKATD